MKEIIRNINNLQEEEMTDFVKKVKFLIINSKKEILLAYQRNSYEFPGGTNEKNETLLQTVNRELLEETGIKLNITDIKPFACSKGYYKDWPEINRNKKIEIYYYEIITDEKPNFNNMCLTENEKNNNFRLEYVLLDNIKSVVKENTEKYDDDRGIAREMLELLEIYKTL